MENSQDMGDKLFIMEKHMKEVLKMESLMGLELSLSKEKTSSCYMKDLLSMGINTAREL